jgi:hypothetical protein
MELMEVLRCRAFLQSKTPKGDGAFQPGNDMARDLSW